jgi:hypothetical protein
MTSEPKQPDDRDNIISLREARQRQAAAQAQQKPVPEKKMPVLLIFLGLLAVLVAYKMLLK